MWGGVGAGWLWGGAGAAGLLLPTAARSGPWVGLRVRARRCAGEPQPPARGEVAMSSPEAEGEPGTAPSLAPWFVVVGTAMVMAARRMGRGLGECRPCGECGGLAVAPPPTNARVSAVATSAAAPTRSKLRLREGGAAAAAVGRAGAQPPYVKLRWGWLGLGLGLGSGGCWGVPGPGSDLGLGLLAAGDVGTTTARPRCVQGGEGGEGGGWVLCCSVAGRWGPSPGGCVSQAASTPDSPPDPASCSWCWGRCSGVPCALVLLWGSGVLGTCVPG